MISLRDGYGSLLVELGETYPDLVVLDADVASSTRSIEFSQRFPDRFFNVGIAEQNMIGISAGLALSQKIPIVNGFSCFLIERAYNQIKQSIAYPNLKVILGGSHPGLSSSEDGASHQMFTDISVMRALPNFTIVAPSDDIELRQAFFSLVNQPGPGYIRLGKVPIQRVNDQTYRFSLGEPVVLREGEDLAILTYGSLVSFALEAAQQLASRGIEASVINVHTLKPLSSSLVDLCQMSKKVLTIEEQSVIGGLGSAVAELLAPYRLIQHTIMGLPDRFGKSGSFHQLFQHFGLTVHRLVEEAEALLRDQ